MRPTGSIRGLIGKLLGREKKTWENPFSDQLPVIEADEALLPAEELRALEKALGYQVNDPRCFVQALTHRSYLQISENQYTRSNERLEFLGDSILNVLIGEFLFRHYTDVAEGELTKLRSRLVNKKALILGAREVNLERFVMLSISAEQSLKQGNHAILADAFEAIVAAIYLDCGMKLRPVKEFLARTLLRPEIFEEIMSLDENYKSALLELAQGQGYDAPRYEVIAQEGPDHARLFTVEVYVNGVVLGKGSGRSKKKAEQKAARVGVKKFSTLKSTGFEGDNQAV
ncbi:MAG: ribonuclease III [Chlorobi bacterium]|nr:ribonuclease III [Chlorobiota bacterium]